MRSYRLLPVLALLAPLAAPAAAQSPATGRIQGTVVHADGNPVGGVTVVIDQLSRAYLTGSDGRFSFDRVPVGTYSLTFSVGDHLATREDVVVEAERTAELRQEVQWDLRFAETITVYSASRRAERIVEAPAAVTLITDEEVDRKAATGQVPKLLEATPGAEITQSGLYDFNFNTRGFNSSLNRRVQVLIDGRDPSVPFLGSQEWAAVSFPLDELASMELVRGPGSALYGADAFNGVLDMVTKSARDYPGGQLRLTGGDLSTKRGDFRWGGGVGNDWYLKLFGGYSESGDFSVSRNQSVEYAGLDREAIPLVRTSDHIGFGGVRLDKSFAGGNLLTLEAGTATIEGPVFQTGIGRVQVTDVDRPYARFNFNTGHLNFMGYWMNRDANDQRSLRAGAPLYLDTDRWAFEVQGNTGFAEGRGFVVGGASYIGEKIDSADPEGHQTLMFASHDEDFQAVYGQVEWAFTDRLKGVLAARVDDSTLHDTQVSPRASLVYSVNPHHTLRFSYNQAFQVPNYSEFFLAVPVAPPTNAFAPFNAICQAGGVDCGFGATPVFAVGNEDLKVEEIETLEIGYTGIIGPKLYLTVDLYANSYDNFITDLIPFVNSRLGVINDNFAPYAPPAELVAPLQALLLGTLQASLPPSTYETLTNDPITGGPLLTAVSYVNFGNVDAQGAEIAFNYYIDDHWLLDGSWSYFDFSVDNQLPEDPILPNTADNKYALGISYLGDRFDCSLKGRAVESFQWNAGVFRGPVPSYQVFNLNANYRINDSLRVGLDVSNVFDDQHYESFGGDILERRALGYVTFSW